MAKHSILGRIPVTLDKKDWTLLSLVQADGRMSFAELGRRVGLSAASTAERLRRLEDAGIVSGFHARVNPANLGLTLLVLIEVVVKRSEYGRFQKAVADLAWIQECHHISGRASFLVKAAVPDVEGLETLIGHLSQFGDTHTSIILSTVVDRREFQRPE
jgi:Lrp/AsnC family leucine-responsive transcriptional regulator